MMLIETLAQTPDVGTLDAFAAKITSALRLWVTVRNAPCRFRVVADRLSSDRAAAHFHLLLEELGAAWPEPFCVSPPCCPRLSHDEALLADMVALARGADRPGFDRLLSDLVPAPVRDRLFLTASVLSRLLQD